MDFNHCLTDGVTYSDRESYGIEQSALTIGGIYSLWGVLNIRKSIKYID